VPARHRSSASLLRRLEAASARNREAPEDNQRLRRQLAFALGQLRAAVRTLSHMIVLLAPEKRKRVYNVT